MKLTFTIYGLTTILLLAACRETRKNKFAFPERASVASEKVIVHDSLAAVYIGGYGSSMAYNAKDSTFWLLTDRGPNVDGPTSESKVFPLPDYTPHVGVFRLQGDSLVLLHRIFLKDSTGMEFSGLPNADGDGKTGETAYDLNGRIIRNVERRGIDPEGLALAPDGTFWVSDEYGPYLLHFTSDGRLIEERSPFNGKLPVHYLHRRPNRGMEGLTMSPDGRLLVGMMQSPLNVPEGQPSVFSEFIPIIAIDLVTNDYVEYRYKPEDPANGVSEIAYLNDTTFLVLERDGKFPTNGEGFKRIYRISLSSRTDVPVKKELACDLLQVLPGYAHDKPEGMTFVGDSLLCVVNDDDFGITASGQTEVSFGPKLRKDKQRDTNEVYFIRLPR